MKKIPTAEEFFKIRKCRVFSNGEIKDIETFVNNNKKEAVVQAINQFLIWYNKQTI